MGKKLTYEYVKQYFKDNNCELLEDEYINSRTKMKYKCSCGNTSEIRFSDFKNGHRCNKCGTKRTRDKLSHSYKYIKQLFKDQGCELLEKDYVDNHTNMKYICSCGNSAEITFNRFQYGHRCMRCGNDKISGHNHHNWNPDRNVVRKTKEIHNLSASYKNNYRKKHNI